MCFFGKKNSDQVFLLLKMCYALIGLIPRSNIAFSENNKIVVCLIFAFAIGVFANCLKKESFYIFDRNQYHCSPFNGHSLLLYSI